jgi:hypothetical protein
MALTRQSGEALNLANPQVKSGNVPRVTIHPQ